MSDQTQILEAYSDRLRHEGFLHLQGRQTFARLAPALAAWPAFAASWNDLGPDSYMADGGRYRRRRHAVFDLLEGKVERKAHQPHFQSRDYNILNGGVQRWFDPVSDAVASSPISQAIFALCGTVFGLLSPAGTAWHCEFHQFRIETTPQQLGRPTPEGLHRDGVDWVFVMLVDRVNVVEGVTEIGTPDGTPLGSFTLTAPGDAVLLDDHRILHGVTPIHAIDPALPAYRDALVVTLTAR